MGYDSSESLPLAAAIGPCCKGAGLEVDILAFVSLQGEGFVTVVGLPFVERHSKGDGSLSLASNPFERDSVVVGIAAGVGKVLHLGMGEGSAESEISAFKG